MKKDAYYFPHFCNARNDRKLLRLRKELGPEGYGIFFMILEVLRDQTSFIYPMSDIDLLSDDFGTSEQKVRTVICNYDLFEINDDESFFSPKQILYLQPYLEKSQRARDAAMVRWGKIKHANADANALQMHYKCNADQNASKVNKVKEIKESKYIKETQNSQFIPVSQIHPEENPLNEKIATYWYTKYNKWYTENSKNISIPNFAGKNDFQKSIQLCEKLQNNENDIKQVIDYYWDNYESFWFYEKNKSHSFSSVVGNIDHVIDQFNENKKTTPYKFTEEDHEAFMTVGRPKKDE